MFGLKGVFDNEALIKGLVIQDNKESVDDKAIVECDGFIQYEALLKKDFACVLTSGEVDNIDYIPPTEMPICPAGSEIDYEAPGYPYTPPEPGEDVTENDDETIYSKLRWDTTKCTPEGSAFYYLGQHYIFISVYSNQEVVLTEIDAYGTIRWYVDTTELTSGSVTHVLSPDQKSAKYTFSLDCSGSILVTVTDPFRKAYAYISIDTPPDYQWIAEGFYFLYEGYYRRIYMDSFTSYTYSSGLGYIEFTGDSLDNARVKLSPGYYSLIEFDVAFSYSKYRHDETYYTTYYVTHQLTIECTEVLVDDESPDPDHPNAWATLHYTYYRKYTVTETEDPLRYVGEYFLWVNEDDEDTIYFESEEVEPGVFRWYGDLYYYGSNYVTVTFYTNPEVITWEGWDYDSGELEYDDEWIDYRIEAIFDISGSAPALIISQCLLPQEDGETAYLVGYSYNGFTFVYSWTNVRFPNKVGYWYLPSEPLGWLGYLTESYEDSIPYYFPGGWTLEKF